MHRFFFSVSALQRVVTGLVHVLIYVYIVMALFWLSVFSPPSVIYIEVVKLIEQEIGLIFTFKDQRHILGGALMAHQYICSGCDIIARRRRAIFV